MCSESLPLLRDVRTTSGLKGAWSEGGRRRKRGSDNAAGTLSWLPVAVLPASVGDFHAVHLRVDLMVTYGDTLAGCASRRVPPFLLILGGVC